MGRGLLPHSGPCHRRRGGAGWGPPAGRVGWPLARSVPLRWVPPMQRERKRERRPRRARAYGHRKEALSVMLGTPSRHAAQ
eukprot:scaffold106868_cov78-Phaeocystis_antarctica.AAC.3